MKSVFTVLFSVIFMAMRGEKDLLAEWRNGLGELGSYIPENRES
ncbi:hypothetical protein [Effusibacillus dendaii]|nr:hypothetical protein [Effusibacillus dendaii]